MITEIWISGVILSIIILLLPLESAKDAEIQRFMKVAFFSNLLLGWTMIPFLFTLYLLIIMLL